MRVPQISRIPTDFFDLCGHWDYIRKSPNLMREHKIGEEKDEYGNLYLMKGGD